MSEWRGAAPRSAPVRVGGTVQLEQFRMLIGGKAGEAISGRTFESENPYTGRPWAAIPGGGPEDVDAAVQAARAALDGEWGSMTGFGRARLMRLLGGLITGRAARLGQGEGNTSPEPH